jgi:glycosyltransferase involved in cell wall biosynthesis
VLASSTAPVLDVIRDDENGFLTSFFDTEALATRALDLIARRDEVAHVGLAGRETVRRKYDFETVGLPAYLALLAPDAQVAREAA